MLSRHKTGEQSGKGGMAVLRVMCVDDEKQPLQYLVSLCEKTADIGEIYSFDRARKALDWLKDHPCDLALLDICLPDMNGITLAQRIQELRPATDIVFVTGHPRFVVDAWSVHPKGYLLKPVTKKDLQEELDYILSLRSPCRRA